MYVNKIGSLTGKVAIFDGQAASHDVLHEAIFSNEMRLGTALHAVDLNNDGHDELVIGSEQGMHPDRYFDISVKVVDHLDLLTYQLIFLKLLPTNISL